MLRARSKTGSATISNKQEMFKMPKWNLGVRSIIIPAGLLWLLWPISGLAFDASTDHTCVANCGVPAHTQAVRPGAALSPSMQQFGAAVGNAIGRSLSGNQGNAPDNRQNEAARQYLDQWENDDSNVAASNSYNQGNSPSDHGGLRVVNAPQLDQPEPDGDKSQNTVLRVLNQTPSYVTVSIDGSYGCNTAGGTTCVIPVLKGQHILRAVRTDTGASFSQSVNITIGGLVWPLSGN